MSTYWLYLSWIGSMGILELVPAASWLELGLPKILQSFRAEKIALKVGAKK